MKKQAISRLLRFKTKKEKEPTPEPEDQEEDSQLEPAASESRNPSGALKTPHRSESLVCPNKECGKTIPEPYKMVDLHACIRSERNAWSPRIAIPD